MGVLRSNDPVPGRCKVLPVIIVPAVLGLLPADELLLRFVVLLRIRAEGSLPSWLWQRGPWSNPAAAAGMSMDVLQPAWLVGLGLPALMHS